MLDCNLFEVLLPVCIKSILFLSEGIKLRHDFIQARLESVLERDVVLVARLNYGLVVHSVLDLDFSVELVGLFLRFVLGW